MGRSAGGGADTWSCRRSRRRGLFHVLYIDSDVSEGFNGDDVSAHRDFFIYLFFTSALPTVHHASSSRPHRKRRETHACHRRSDNLVILTDAARAPALCLPIHSDEDCLDDCLRARTMTYGFLHGDRSIQLAANQQANRPGTVIQVNNRSIKSKLLCNFFFLSSFLFLNKVQRWGQLSSTTCFR